MVYKLADVCDVRDGTHDSPKYVSEGYPLVTSKNIVDGKLDLSIVSYLSQEDYDKINERSKVDSGDIIMPMIGTIGNPYLVEEYSNFAIKNVALIKFPNADISNKFVWYFLKSPAFKRYVDEKNKGGTQKFLSLGDIRNMEIPQISIDKQLSIVEKMEKISSVLRLRQQELDALDDLIKSRFVEMFGDPDINSKGWDEYPLSEKLNVLGGYAFKSDQFDENDGIPILRIGNINAGYFKPVNMVYWQEDESLERYAMYPGDLVMSLTGTVGKDDYGNVCILGDDYEMYYLNQRNAKLEIKEGIDKYFLSQLLKFEQIKKRLTGISRGVRQANISNKDILNLVVPVPPMEIQEQFASFVHQTDKLKLAVQKSLDETQELFDSLMQKYFG